MRKTNVIRLVPDNEARLVLKAVADRVSAPWDAANYICRQAFIKGEKVPNYSVLCAVMKDTPDYRALPTHIGQEVLKKLGKSWASFFGLRRVHTAGRLKDRPGLAKYRKDRKKNARACDYIPVKSPLAYRVEGSVIYLAMPGDIRAGRMAIPFRGVIRHRGEPKTCELQYDNVNQGWYAHLVVECPEREPMKPRPVKHAGGDIGARRIITISVEDNPLSVIYSSRAAWKDYKYWSRRIAEEKSRLSTQGYKTSRYLQGLYRKRRLRLRHAMEALASGVVNQLMWQRVTYFTVGYPVNCRDDAWFGRGNELVHNFWSYEILLSLLERHSVRRGIVFERANERGTSSHCHICGRKVTRPRTDTVVCKIHGPMQADVNASKNILGKKTPAMAGDGEKASLVWAVMRWDTHRWLSHAESANNRVLRAA